MITLDWRGHGDSSRPSTDFGNEEFADYAMAVIEASASAALWPCPRRTAAGRRSSSAAGSVTGWRRSSRRAGSSRSAAAVVAALEAAQNPERWREAREQLFSMWLTGGPEGIVEEVHREVGAYDFDIWARAGPAIMGDLARKRRRPHSPTRRR